MAISISYDDANSGFQAGLINGPVSTEFHLPPERLETLPNPSIFIPFSRDRDFVARGTILDQVDQKCSIPGSRTALVGLGGVGKSQLAIEYAYRARECSPETWVFWVYASNAARFEQSCRGVADAAKIAGRRDPKADIFKLVHDWLLDQRRTKWVIILDNVDDAGFLLEARSTSRALKLVEWRDLIVVEPMNKEDALALLEKKLGIPDDKDSATELTTALEFMPLAIVQAAAYITQRIPRCSVLQYLEEFRDNDSKKSIGLLSHKGGGLRRDREAKNSIIVCLQRSFNCIQQTRPSAANLLSLISLFDRQGISDDLLRTRDARVGFKQLVPSEVRKISAHRNYEEANFFQDLATRERLERNGRLEKWQRQYIKNLYREFPREDYKNWTKCQELLPHVKAALTLKLKEKRAFDVWISLLSNAAWYANLSKRSEEAESLWVQVMEARKSKLGVDHPDTLTSMGNLASTYRNQGRWDEAELLEVQVMETRKSKLGVDHPDTLTSINNLALTFKGRGEEEKAIKIIEKCVGKRKHILGRDHPYTKDPEDTLNSWRMEGLFLGTLNEEREGPRGCVCVQEVRLAVGSAQQDSGNAMAEFVGDMNLYISEA
ncbi:hypothetical protein CC78DRAFT_560967 [Lojkania enalia]|uniref:NB-ARC domain-containing protein n=1 Tax=Lojkania enalia TaxID=147567 RepID=A0A9P4K581_9PLEO|nr:hypothetical protein CC78DRAFT_560967 [Didymosphaeria enalia]